MTLNDKQQSIVNYFDEENGKIAIVEAEPGTGKTFTAIATAINYIQSRIKLYGQFKKKILILTFSKNARAQIEKQLDSYPAEEMVKKLVEISNFHSFYQRFIWAYSGRLKMECDEIQILSENQRKLKLSEKLTDIYEFDIDVYEHFDWVDNLLEFDSYPHLSPSKKRKVHPLLIHKQTIQNKIIELNREGLIGFSDMAYHFIQLMRKSEKLLNLVSSKYPLIIIDEYQDVSDNQDELIDLLRAKDNNTLFFADRNQQIYEWRGANPDRVAERRIKHCGSIIDETFDVNYRYGSKTDIVDLLKNIKEGQHTEVVTTSNIKCIDARVRVPQLSLFNRQSKFMMFASMTYSILNNLPNYSERKGKSFGILCRTNEQVDYYKKRLLKEHNIRTKNINNNSVEHNVIGDMIAFMKEHSEGCNNELLTYEGIRFIFDIIVDKQIGSLKKVELNDTTIRKINGMRKAIIKGVIAISLEFQDSFEIFDFYKKIYNLVLKSDDFELVDDVRLLLKKVFIKKIDSQGMLSVFLMHQHLQAHKELDGIYVLNHHQSKGREFDNVYVIDEKGLKSDKNLYYVALSRAKEKLFLLNWVIA